MPFKLGTTDIAAIHLGTTRVKKISLGNTQIWPEATLPDAVAPRAIINRIPDGAVGTTVVLGVTVSGGTYDALEYAWSGEGEFDDATSATPTWTRPSERPEDGLASVSVTVTAKGTGTIAKDGTSDSWSSARSAEVTPGLPDAVAPSSVVIAAVASGQEGTKVDLTATVTGGTYDSLEYAWTVSGGSLSSASAASPKWTRPAVDADGTVNINLTVTAKGTGTLATDGTSAAKSAAQVTAAVTDTPVTPTLPDPVTLSSSQTWNLPPAWAGVTRIKLTIVGGEQGQRGGRGSGGTRSAVPNESCVGFANPNHPCYTDGNTQECFPRTSFSLNTVGLSGSAGGATSVRIGSATQSANGGQTKTVTVDLGTATSLGITIGAGGRGGSGGYGWWATYSGTCGGSYNYSTSESGGTRGGTGARGAAGSVKIEAVA